MNLLGRYLRNAIFAAVAFALVAFLALFVFFDFINELDAVGSGGYRLQHALVFILLTVPTHVYELMPIVALIGGIYALAQLAANSEFTAMRAAGLGRSRALGVALRVGVVLALFTALFGELIAPPADRLAQQLRLSAIGGSVTGMFRSGLWIKDSSRDETGQAQAIRFVNIAELLPDGALRGVRIFEFDADMHLTRIVRAKSATVGEATGWSLSEVEQLLFNEVQLAHETTSVGAERIVSPALTWRTEVRPELLNVLLIEPDRMSALSLYRYIAHLRANVQDTHVYEIALWKKLVYPLAAIVMMALALPFAYLQARAGGVGYKVFAGIMLGIGFHFSNGLFAHLGMLNAWPPLLTVAFPSVFAMLVALGMLAWVDRTR